MNKYLNSALVLALASTFMIGCSDDSDDDVTPPVAKKYNAVFVDSVVSGITFKCGGLTGLTDDDGVFLACEAGVPVSFNLGTVKLGTVTNTAVFGDGEFGPVLTPYTIAGTDDANVSSKIAIMLQSMDYDGDLTNGIQITSEVTDLVSAHYPDGLDLTSSEVTVSEVEQGVREIAIKSLNPLPAAARASARAGDKGDLDLQPVTKDVADANLVTGVAEYGDKGPANGTTPTGAAS